MRALIIASSMICGAKNFRATMRSVFFNLARHDDEFRKLLRQVVQENPIADINNQ